MMSPNQEFYEGLDPKDAVGTTLSFLRTFSPLYAGTVGLDGRPQVRPADFAFEKEGAFYFLTLKSSRFYAELSKTPYLQLCNCDLEAGTVFRLSGKACFTEDEAIIERGIKERPDMLERAGGERKMLIAFFLLEAQTTLEAEEASVPEMNLRLPDPNGVLIGITIKKKTELRDRLVRVLERRENEPPALDPELARVYDGAIFVFAEAAKAIWPRMDIRPIERAAVFETWDEREKYTALAATLIGNAVIDSPEDITYWLNPDTLKGLL